MTDRIKMEMETMRGIPELIGNFIKDVPSERMDLRRSESAWTIREHFLHLVQVQDMLLRRFKLIREQENPVIEPYFPEDDDINDLTIEDAMEKYRSYRKLQIEEIMKCTDEDFERRAVHKEYNEYSIPILIRHMIFHEYWHMYRIEELLYTKEEFFQ